MRISTVIGNRRVLLPLLGAGALGLVSAIAIAQEGEAPATAGAEPQIDAATLATRIMEETGKLAPTSSVTDYEASIMFSVSQSNSPDELVISALEMVAARPDLSPTMKAAVENILRSLRQKKLSRGTGAIGDGGISSSFSAPAIGLGGGSANYSS